MQKNRLNLIIYIIGLGNKIKVCLHTICLCTVYIYYVYVNTHTYTCVYISRTNMLDIFIYKINSIHVYIQIRLIF